MKRQVITIQEDMVIYAPHHGEVWMTAWEIAELFNVSGVTVRNTIKRIFKQGVLKEFEAAKYITLDNGNKADVYSMEMVMAIAFQLNTSWAQIFRKWMVERVVNKEKVEREWQKTEHPMIVMMNNSKDFN